MLTKEEMMGLTLTKKLNQEKNEWEVYISGEIVINTKDSFSDFIDGLENLEHTDVTLYCQKLEFIDSIGLGIFIRLAKKLRANQRKINVVGLKHQMMRIFKLTKIDDMFDRLEEGEYGQN